MRTQGRSVDHVRITTTAYIPSVAYGVASSRQFTEAYHADACAAGQTAKSMAHPNQPSGINKEGATNQADAMMLCIGVVIGIAGAVLLGIQ